jgi:hypothetical protein
VLGTTKLYDAFLLTPGMFGASSSDMFEPALDYLSFSLIDVELIPLVLSEGEPPPLLL